MPFVMPRACRAFFESRIETPSNGRMICPFCISIPAIDLTVSEGIAKPTPVDAPLGEKIAVAIPIILPDESRRGPPLF